MSKELFIVIIIFSVLVLTIAVTTYLYHNRINRKVKAYINDKDVSGGIRMPSLTYILGIIALASLIVSSGIYLIPRQKLYEVEYVLYTHPESMTIVIGEEDNDFSLERLMETISITAKDLSNSDNCDVLINPDDPNNNIIIKTKDGLIESIIIPNLVIVYHNNKIAEDAKESSMRYETPYTEYKEYSVTYEAETHRIILKATMYANDGGFNWGPVDSSVYKYDVKESYDSFKESYDEFLLNEEEVFIYEFVIVEDNNENTLD